MPPTPSERSVYPDDHSRRAGGAPCPRQPRVCGRRFRLVPSRCCWDWRPGSGVELITLTWAGQVSALRNRMTPFREERARRYQLKAPRRISPQIPNEKLRARCGSPGSS